MAISANASCLQQAARASWQKPIANLHKHPSPAAYLYFPSRAPRLTSSLFFPPAQPGGCGSPSRLRKVGGSIQNPRRCCYRRRNRYQEGGSHGGLQRSRRVGVRAEAAVGGGGRLRAALVPGRLQGGAQRGHRQPGARRADVLLRVRGPQE